MQLGTLKLKGSRNTIATVSFRCHHTISLQSQLKEEIIYLAFSSMFQSVIVGKSRQQHKCSYSESRAEREYIPIPCLVLLSQFPPACYTTGPDLQGMMSLTQGFILTIKFLKRWLIVSESLLLWQRIFLFLALIWGYT